MVTLEDLKKRPFGRIVFFFAFGIIVGYKLPIASSGLTSILIFWMLLVFLVLLLELFYASVLRLFKSMLLFLVFFLLGFMLVNHQDWQLSPSYFAKSQGPYLLVQVVDEPFRKGKTTRSVVKVLAVVNKGSCHNTEGQLLLTLASPLRDSSFLEYGDQLLVPNETKDIPIAYNPSEFDYSSYLKNKRIYKQLYVHGAQCLRLQAREGSPFISASLALRKKLLAKFALYFKNEASFSIASALILGYRKSISPELQSSFSSTGVVHVLSVSGLHVSLVFAFLSYLLKPLDRYRWGKYARLILIGLCIWCYVFLTGLAPPILRAGIMLSFYLLSLAILRQQDNVNTLFASAFLILLLDCRMLFTIGFQLSYAAVFGIFTLYPLALRLYQVKHVVVNSLLKFCYLSLSAQLFTAPLALYYFNQFPTYFLLGNLCVALPIVGIMYAGITLALIPMESVAKPIAWLMERLITVLLEILHVLEGLPSAVQQGIAFEEWQALWAYALLLLFIYVCRTASKRAFWLLHMLLLGFIVVHISGMLQQRRFAGVKVYNMQKEVAIAYIRGGEVHVLSTADSLHQPSLQYHVHPDLKHYCALDAVFFTHMDAHRNVRWQLGDFTMLVVQDAPEGMDLSAIDLVLWRNNPKFPVHPSAWSSMMHIMDGSNNAATLSLWQGEMQALDMPYYKLKNNFAYVWTRKH